MHTHQKIRFVRDKKDLSQMYMASQLNISQSKYNKFENGKLKISIESFNQICRILDIRMDDLYHLSIEEQTNEYLQKK